MSQNPQHTPPQPATPLSANGYAVAALVLGILGLTLLSYRFTGDIAMNLIPFLFSVGAILSGHLARGKIRRQPQQGDGLALAGLVLGWICVAIWALGVVLYFLLSGRFG